MTKDKALKLALEALEKYQTKRQDFDRFADEITAIKEALAQPEQEPVEWQGNAGSGWRGITPTKREPTQKLRAEYLAAIKTAKGEPAYKIRALYTSPPKREWVWLTGDERTHALQFSKALAIMHIEAKLKEKNHD